MARDIIFSEKKPINSAQMCFQQHMNCNGTIELMKKEIRTAITVKDATRILMEKFGRDYLLFISVALREVFQISEKQIEKSLCICE